MREKILLNIPEPCHENWQNMTQVEKGRFCSSCQKTVLDFSHLSDNEIIKLVSKNDNLCGRISVSQLNRNLIETKRTSNYFGYVATSVLAFLGLGTSSIVAQEKPLQEQTDSKHLNKVTNSVKKITVSGLVTSEGAPLPGVIVRIKNKKKYVTTDEFGKYSIEVKKGKTLVFSYLGLEDVKVKVIHNTVNAILQRGDTFIGMVVIE